MLKKLSVFLLAAMLLTSSAVFAFAADNPPTVNSQEDPTIMRYSAIRAIDPYFYLAGSTATVSLEITPRSTDAIDYVDVTVKIISSDTGAAAKTWNQRLKPNAYNFFAFQGEHRLTSRGAYYAQYSGTAYKNGGRVDTFFLESGEVVY